MLQGLDISTLGVFVSCLCATGIEQKVLARKASLLDESFPNPSSTSISD